MCIYLDILANWFVGDRCANDSRENMEDDMIVRVRGLSPIVSQKELGGELALGSKRFECWSSEEICERGLSID